VVEPVFIKVLGLETQPYLLAMAGVALLSNPQVNLPPHIYDTLLLSRRPLELRESMCQARQQPLEALQETLREMLS
jgi:hypothetical protein